MKYYSTSTGGFYDSEINVVMPQDAIEVDDALHMTLLAGQAAGKVIVYSDGVLSLAEVHRVSECFDLGYPMTFSEALLRKSSLKRATPNPAVAMARPPSEDGPVL